jgi:uncharacterized membrane protein
MAPPLPWFIVPLCVAAGVVMIALGLPLYLRRVPPNPFYGIRLRSTRGDDRVWYEINARAGRDMMVLGAVYLGLFGLAMRQSWIPAFRVLVPVTVLAIGVIADTIVLMSAASRLAGER